jgi:hypothetical protein
MLPSVLGAAASPSTFDSGDIKPERAPLLSAKLQVVSYDPIVAPSQCFARRLPARTFGNARSAALKYKKSSRNPEYPHAQLIIIVSPITSFVYNYHLFTFLIHY